MAVKAQSFLNLTGLSRYDGKIKAWSNSAEQAGFKTVLKSADGNNLLFYVKPSATLEDTADFTIALGGADAQAQLEALAAIVAATYVTDPETGAKSYAITGLNTTSQATLVGAINELVSHIGTLGSLKTVTKTDVVSAINQVADKLGFSDSSFAFAPTSVSVAAATNGGEATATTVDTVKAYIDAKVSDAKNTAAAAIDALDVAEAPIAEVNNNVVTIHGISESNGAVAVGVSAANDIVLEEVAYTGAAADVSNTAITGLTLTSVATTNVQDTLQALKNLIDSTADNSAITLDEVAGSGSTLKSYVLYQGGTQTAGVTTGGTEIGTINIPHDFLVNAAEVKTVSTADKGEGGIFENDESFRVGAKYIDFEINTKNSSSGQVTHLYLAVDDLMAAISGATNATGDVTVNVSAANVITAELNNFDADKATYKAAVAAVGEPGDPDYVEAKARESVKAALTRIDGADTVDGSIAKAVKDAVESLDTASDVAVATYTAGTSGAADVITLTGSVAESDGIIETGSGDTITLSTITNAEIDALFAGE